MAKMVSHWKSKKQIISSGNYDRKTDDADDPALLHSLERAAGGTGIQIE